MAAKKTTDLAKKKNENTALAVGGSFDYGDMAGQGFENTSTQDCTIPFLAILQVNSPQVMKSKPEFIEGAEAGQLINTASRDLYDGETGVTFVPCYTEHVFVEWKNRQKDSGGFVAIHECDSEVVRSAKEASKEFGKYTVPVADGVPHDLVETYYMYGLLVDEAGDTSPCMIAFCSTKIKAYKGIMTPMMQVKGRPPLFAFQLKVRSVSDSNAKGDFFNFRIDPVGNSVKESLMAPDNPIVLAGKDFRDQVSSGQAKVDHGKQNTGGEEDCDKPAPF